MECVRCHNYNTQYMAYPIKHTHGFVVRCCVVVTAFCLVDSCDTFAYTVCRHWAIIWFSISGKVIIWLNAWWRHQMEIFSALLALCAGNSAVTGEFPSQRPVTRSFGVFYDMCLNKRLRKQSWGWWFETPSRILWRHRNGPDDSLNVSKVIPAHQTSESVSGIIYPQQPIIVCQISKKFTWYEPCFQWRWSQILSYLRGFTVTTTGLSHLARYTLRSARRTPGNVYTQVVQHGASLSPQHTWQPQLGYVKCTVYPVNKAHSFVYNFVVVQFSVLVD